MWKNWAVCQCFGVLMIAGCGEGLPVEVPPEDAAVDAASSPPRFEIIWISDLSVTSAAPEAFDLGVIVNRGDAPLDLSDARIVMNTDNDARIDFELLVQGSATPLPPGKAAGRLNPASRAKIVDSGLLDAPLVDDEYSFGVVLKNTPPGVNVVIASAVLEIGGVSVQMPFWVFHGVDASFNATNQVASPPKR